MSNWELAIGDRRWLPDEDIAGWNVSVVPFQQIGYPTPKHWGHALKFTSDGRFLAIWGARDRVVGSIAFSKNGRRMATGCNDDYVRHIPKMSAAVILWDMVTGQQIRALAGHDTDIISVAFSPDDRLLATGSTKILIFDTSTGSAAWEGDPCRNWTSALTWSADGQYLLSNCNRSIVLLRRK